MDGSRKTDASNSTWELEKDFAKSTVAAFEDKNLFVNGGSASYVQSSLNALDTNSGTFHSLEEFESHADAVDFVRERSSIHVGIEQARSLLSAAPPASAAFLIIIVNAANSLPLFTQSKEQANAARGEGVDVFVVAIGGEIL